MVTGIDSFTLSFLLYERKKERSKIPLPIASWCR